MNKLLVKALLTSTLVVLATAITASAQFAGTVDATIPFRFYAGDTWLPAGKYTIKADPEDQDLLLLRNANDTVEVFLLVTTATRPQPASETALDFDRIGKRDFLSTIWVEGTTIGYQLQEPRLEVKLEKAAMRKEKHTVKAVHHKPA